MYCIYVTAYITLVKKIDAETRPLFDAQKQELSTYFQNDCGTTQVQLLLEVQH